MLVPKLRFKRDDGTEYPEWEETCVGKVFDKVKDKNKGCSNTNVITNSAEFGLISQRDFFDKDIAVEGKTDNYTIIKTNDFVYNPRKSSFAPFGVFNGYTLADNGIVSPLYFCLRMKNNEMSASFMLWYFKSSRWHRFIYENGEQGGARHDRVGVSEEMLKGIPIDKPCLEEQQKIADFLSTVDEVIAQSAKEVQNLEQQKKAAMQKIFSQEVRFKREDGRDYPEWKTDIISNICSIKTGESNSQDQSENGAYPFYIRSEKPVRSNRFLYDCEAVLTIGDGNIGKVFHYVNGKFDLHQRVYIMNEFHNVNAKYFYYYFSMFFYQRAMRLNAKGTVNSVRRAMIADMTIPVPCLEEQQKIADFLSAYDEAISYATQELDKWNELKKGLLQQMFV